MPRPLLLDRPAGVYVGFRVPTSLRLLVGLRFLVRPLRQPIGQAARLAAAVLDMALCDGFRRLRQGEAVDIKKVLKLAQDRADLIIGASRYQMVSNFVMCGLKRLKTSANSAN